MPIMVCEEKLKLGARAGRRELVKLNFSHHISFQITPTIPAYKCCWARPDATANRRSLYYSANGHHLVRVLGRKGIPVALPTPEGMWDSCLFMSNCLFVSKVGVIWVLVSGPRPTSEPRSSGVNYAAFAACHATKKVTIITPIYTCKGDEEQEVE